MSIKKTALIEKGNNYLRSQINDLDGKKFIKRQNLLNFSILKENQSTKKSGLMRKIIIPLSIAVYPLQKLVSTIGGDIAVLGSVSILSVPLSIYIMGEIASGYYLWVYCIGKLEKEYKSNITC